MPPVVARPSARHRSVVAVLLLAFILLGFFALGRMPVEAPASGEAPRLHVRVAMPGVDAATLEGMLTRPLERALAGIPGVAAMDSVTEAGAIDIGLSLKHRRDVESVQRDVASRLQQAAASWPASMEPAVLAWTDPAAVAAEFVLVSRTGDALALRDWAEAEFARRLRELDGVATVDVAGGSVREILVLPDQRRLAGYGLSFEDLLRAIRMNPEADSRARPAPLKGRARLEPVQSGNLAAVAAVPVTLPGGESIQLAEVARLALAHGAAPSAFRVDGAEAVKLTVNRQAHARLSDVAEGVRAHVDWMRANRLVPGDIAIHSFTSPLNEARRSLRQSGRALIAGIALVLFGAWLLLGSGRRALILGVTVAAALQGVFVMMILSGAALDAMTLGALALGSGLFGGSVLLMFEAAARATARPPAAADPVIATAIAMLAALLPVWFSGGPGFDRETVSVFAGAWLLAALLAWWLVPMFDARRRPPAAATRGAAVLHGLAVVRRFYDGLLRRLLRRAVTALLVSVLVFGALAAVMFAGDRDRTPSPTATGPEIILRLQGPDSAVLAALADELAQRMDTAPGLRAAHHSARSAREEWVLRLDEERAHELGVDLGLAGKALAIAVNGVPAGSFRDADRRFDVRLRLPAEEAGGVAAGRILLLGELENRPAVHMRDVATLERLVVPARIRHHDGVPEVEITAQSADDVTPEAAAQRLRAALEGFTLPDGYRLSRGDASRTMRGNSGPAALMLAVFLVFAALALWRRSFRFALPAVLSAGAVLIVTGAVLSAAGMNLSPPAWLGALLLFGVSAGHAAALAGLDGTPARGPDLPRRLAQAARRRFRSLLILVATALLGALSLTWINGVAADLRTLAVIMATGLVFSLPVNLLLTPLLQWLVARKEQTRLPRRL